MGERPAHWPAAWLITARWEQRVTLCYNAAKQQVLRVSRRRTERREKAGAKIKQPSQKLGALSGAYLHDFIVPSELSPAHRVRRSRIHHPRFISLSQGCRQQRETEQFVRPLVLLPQLFFLPHVFIPPFPPPSPTPSSHSAVHNDTES